MVILWDAISQTRTPKAAGSGIVFFYMRKQISMADNLLQKTAKAASLPLSR
jgi:hypothetical protein